MTRRLSPTATATVSCPGKVLATGGYLVLSPEHVGLVLAVNARFQVTVQGVFEGHVEATEEILPKITVSSPQFTDGLWVFDWRDGALEPPADTPPKTLASGRYVQIALSYTLQFALETLGAQDFHKALGQGLNLTIVGDNNFYSQRQELQRRGLPLTRNSLQVLDAHANAHCQISEVHKTGLGSSAAMMTSLVGALLSFFSLCALDSDEGKRITHNLAQFCHCLAQGKVGSGFDVSAAVYGSHLYRRFSPEILKPCLEKAEKGELMGKDLVALVVEREWDAQVQPCDIPRGIRLVLGEVDTGSNTPSMVSKVLQWKSKNPQIAESYWAQLDLLNKQLPLLFDKLKDFEKEDSKGYEALVTTLSAKTLQDCQASSFDSSVSTILQNVLNTRKAFMEIRSIFRDISELADVPIEPKEQTELLDACMDLPGVLLAGVPGAGGFDAIFCLVFGDAPLTALDALWQRYDKSSICPLLCEASRLGILSESTSK